MQEARGGVIFAGGGEGGGGAEEVVTEGRGTLKGEGEHRRARN